MDKIAGVVDKMAVSATASAGKKKTLSLFFCCEVLKKVNFKLYIDDVVYACAEVEAPQLPEAINTFSFFHYDGAFFLL